MPLPSRGEPALTLTERSPYDMYQAVLCRLLKQMKVHIEGWIQEKDSIDASSKDLSSSG